MVSGKQVPVGQVFRLFPGKYDFYVGISVGEYGFRAHDEVVLRRGSDETTVKISSIEIDRRRVNVVKPGDQCAIKVAHPLPDPFRTAEDVEVLVDEARAAKAAAETQVFTPRPTKFEDLKRTEGTSRTFAR